MKVLVLFSLVALCASIPTFFGRHLIVGEDGTITLRNTRGESMDIMRSVMDPSKVEIILRSPMTTPRTYQLDGTLTSLPESTLRNIFGSKYPISNQADTLLDTFRHFEGAVDEESYNRLLNRIQFLIEAGVLPRAMLDVLRTWDVEHTVNTIGDITPFQGVVGIRQSNDFEGLNNLWSVQQDSKHGQWNLNQDMLNNWSPVQRLQTLLEQIKQKRQFQQGLLTGEYYPQENFFQQWTPELVLGQRQESLPIRDTLYHQFGNVYNRADDYFNSRDQQDIVSEQVTISERVQHWSAQQEVINQKVDQFIEQRTAGSPKLVYQQRFLNQEAQEIIEHLVYRQALITRQIEQFVKQRQVVSQEVVVEQRIIYQLVQHMLEKLTQQQAFFNDRLTRAFAVGTLSLQEFFIQQRIIYQQVQQLIQQLFVQQVYLRQHIQVLVQEGNVFPQELVLFQKLTYQQVEKFIQVLFRQLVNQQTSFKQLIQLFVQHKQTIPQELISQYSMIYRELVQLIQHSDFVSQDLIYEQERLHSQIVFLLEHKQIASQETVNQWGPQELRNQWVSEQERMYYQQPEYFQQRELIGY